MHVPLLDLKAQWATIRQEALAAITGVLDSQVCIGGPKVAELEQKVAEYCGAKYAVGASSGTDALLNTLMSLGIGPGDEVITTPFTFFATAGSIARVGAKPVFVDIDPRTYNINPELIESAITRNTQAILPVHLFGQMCDMDPIMKVADKYGLYVIEDAAQAIGATYKNRKAGAIGTAGCFSFFPSKNLGGIGDGGMIVTNDEKLYARLQIMRNHGAKPKYYHQYIGGNFRLDPVQAAVLLVKLPYLDGWSEARRDNAAYYNRELRDAPLRTPYIRPGCQSIYNQYVIALAGRDRLIERLKADGIGTEIYYPQPLHLQQCFEALNTPALSLPEAERAARQVLALPVYPELSQQAKAAVADSVLSFCSTAEMSAVA